jgi:hypothetical protein
MVTSKGRLCFWQGFSLVGLVALTLFASSASANHNSKTHITIGPAGGNSSLSPAYLDAINQDGTLAFFTTDESLVSGDTDSKFDVYQRSVSGTVTLVSIGPNGGNGNGANDDVLFDGISADGSKVFFETAEKLVTGAGGDTDSDSDIYERSGGTTTFLTDGGGGDSVDAFYGGNSSDGVHVFFVTDESLAGTDSDSSQDVYDASGGSIAHVSTVPAGGNLAFTADYLGTNTDGSKVFFDTFEKLDTVNDTDARRDIYERSGGSTTQVSSGNGTFDAFYDAASADGTKVFFDTGEAISGTGDTDTKNDTYQRSGGVTLISTGTTTNGPFDAFHAGNSEDGSKVWFQTPEKVEAGDTDSSQDVYERSGGTTTTRISAGTTSNGAIIATFDGSSTDGSRVFWSTAEKVEAGDTDSNTDVYERSSGTTTRVSVGAINGNGAIPAFFEGSSADGTRVFFVSAESLASGDPDSADDVYERANSTTTHISGGSANQAVVFNAANQSGRRVFFDTQESLLSSDTDGVSDVYSNVSIPYEHPIGASPLRVPLVPAYSDCPSSSVNSTHGAPLAFGSCSPPSRVSSTARMGNGTSIGYVRFVVCNVDSAAAQCSQSGLVKPDVRIMSNLRDVRCVGSVPAGCSAGGDYNPNGATGPYTTSCGTAANCGLDTVQAQPYCAQSGTSSSDCIAGTDVTLTATLPGVAAGNGLRVTDVASGSGQDTAATSVDSGFPVPMDCLPTPSNPTLGSTCGVNTSANALDPGAVRTGDAGVWELGEIQVLDAGTDGTPGDTNDQVLAVQGIYLP